MRWLAIVALLVAACGKDATAPVPTGDYCLSSFSYLAYDEVGDTLRSESSATYGALLCMSFSGDTLIVAPSPPSTPTYQDIAVITPTGQSVTTIYVWYGNKVIAKVFTEGNRLYLTDPSGDLYFLGFSGTVITRDGNTVRTDWIYEEPGLHYFLETVWVRP